MSKPYPVIADWSNTELASALLERDAVAVREHASGDTPANGLVSENGVSILYHAAGNSSADCLEALIDAGANVNWHQAPTSMPPTNGSALNNALADGQFENAQLLLDKGANPNFTDSQMRSALHLFAYNSAPSVIDEASSNHLVRSLIAQGALVDAKDSNGQTPLIDMAYYGTHASSVQILIDSGADLGLLGKDGWGPIHVPWEGAQCDTLRALVGAGVDINLANENGQTPLFFACDGDAIDVVLELGGDREVLDGQRRDALCYAVAEQRGPACIAAFLNRGFSPWRRDVAGKTAVDIANTNPQSEAMKQVVQLFAAHAAREAFERGAGLVTRSARQPPI